jgi:hypothetical protein
MMQCISAFLTAIWLWTRSWFVRPDKPKVPFKTVLLAELPELLDPGSVYVLGEGQYRWFVAMLCPCGCKAVLQVSLLTDAKPRWRLIEHADDGTVTLQPSVWRLEGCRSHFFLRRGRIQWCPG